VTLVDPLWHRARTSPERLALRVGQASLSFADLEACVRAAASRLAGLGVGPGDRVALLLANGVPFVVLVHALARLGTVCVPLSTRLAPPELQERLADCEPSLLVTEPALLAQARQAAEVRVACVDPEHPELLPDAPAYSVRLRLRHPEGALQGILYTSATTGDPKGVALTFGNHVWNAVASNLHLGAGPQDPWLVVLPLYHVGGLAVLWRAALVGAAVVLHERFDPERFCAEVTSGAVAFTSLVPTMLHRVLDVWAGGRPPSRLRAVLLGGGPVPPELVVRATAAGWPVAPTYGLTEAASQVTTLHPEEAPLRPECAGRPLYPVQVRAGRSSDRPAEIEVRGPTVMKGYYGRPADTARALRGGWLRTGDVGYVDPEGYLHVLDRRLDLVVSGGENVYPAEVERVLRSHPGVQDAAVVGVPDPHWGQRPVAFVQPVPGAAPGEAELRAFCRERLAAFKVPDRIWTVPDLPRAGLDKVRRSVLRQEAQRLLRGASTSGAVLHWAWSSSQEHPERSGPMAEITRTASATWTGDLRTGTGHASTQSGVLKDAVVTYPSRFESGQGSNPEELIAAAHAACFSMALAARLSREGTPPERVETRATVTLQTGEAGAKITQVHLQTRAKVPGVDPAKFREAAEGAKEGCPVSQLLKPGLESLTLDAELVS
jgi:O-succinylbenzoic acid--CoA ligase